MFSLTLRGLTWRGPARDERLTYQSKGHGNILNGAAGVEIDERRWSLGR